MKRHTYVALLATLISATAWGQEVSLYGTTMAEMWKQNTPGFDQTTYAPLTQYLGIDATKLGSDGLSLHLFGWGVKDLGDSGPTMYNGTPVGASSGGYLNYGYLQYRFDQANAEIKAGRFTVNQSTGFEQVDGVSARTDLRGGFTISAFGGKPVIYHTEELGSQINYNFQHDFIFGARLAWRLPQITEIGVSYLEDGTKPAQNLAIPQTEDFTRRQMGVDLLVTPTSSFDLRGRTVFDVAKHPEVAPGAPAHNDIAEHDYTATWRLGSQVSVTGNYAERNYFAYFAGTNMPSLFKQDDHDMFRGWGGKVTWTTTANFQMTGDYRHMHRETFGDANSAGGDMRWDFNDKSVLFGIAGHVVNAVDTKFVDPTQPYLSLSHEEARIWTMVTKGQYSASLDCIIQRYDGGDPYLAGARKLYEAVGSLGYQVNPNLKVSGDMSYGTSLVAAHQTVGMLKAEYRFGSAKKGGQ
jgi:hypothetical protein